MHSLGNDIKISENDGEDIELLSHLNKKKLSIIEEKFPKDGLILTDFLNVMLEHLEYKKDDEMELKLTLRLIDLFKEIDVNGDEHLEWQEFSNHIIELGMLKKDRTVKEVIKNYYPSDSVKTSALKQKHDSDIEKLYYFPQIQNIIAIEKDSPKFQVYSAKNPKLLCDVQAHRGAILAAEMVSIQNSPLLATTSIDLTINFWDTQTFKLKQIISTPDIQQILRFCKWKEDSNELLYTGGNDAIIHIYDLRNFREKSILTGWNPFLKRDEDQTGHSGPIMDILPIKEQGILATAALDGKICLWDSETEKNLKTLGGESNHQKGITCLDWYPINHFLLSAGLDHDVFIFNTFVREKIFTLKGHSHPLVGVKWVPGTYQIVTNDISGMVKIWDARTMQCTQTFNASAQEINSFCVTYPTKRVILGAKNMIFYDYDEPRHEYLSDEKMCIRIIYNETLFSFITLHPDNVKVWDARTGEIKSAHRDLTNGELTCCCLDDRQRKLFLGDTLGNIFSINVRNGARLRDFKKHQKPPNSPEKVITDLAYFNKKKDTKVLVTASLCSSIMIHDDSESDPNKSRSNELLHHKREVTCLSIKEAEENQEEGVIIGLSGVVASCSDDSSIIITNLSSYRIEAQPRNTDGVFKRVLFMDNHQCLIATDTEGMVYFFSYSLDRKFEVCYKKYYKSSSQTDLKKIEETPISAIGFDEKDKLLILGDVFGNVEIWDCTSLVAKIDENIAFLNNKFGKNKSQNLYKNNQKAGDKLFITEPKFKKIVASDVELFSTRKRSHSDGITWIDVIPQYRAYATSSYDCCAYIWSLLKNEKLGALYLGGPDVHWKFKVDEDKRKRDEVSKAKEQLLLLEEARKEEAKQKNRAKRRFGSKKETLDHGDAMLKKFEKLMKVRGRQSDSLYYEDSEKSWMYEDKSEDESDNDNEMLHEILALNRKGAGYRY